MTVAPRFLGARPHQTGSQTFSRLYNALSLSRELEPLAKALGPSYYRFGGTNADWLTFVENGTTYSEKLAYNVTNITISGKY